MHDSPTLRAGLPVASRGHARVPSSDLVFYVDVDGVLTSAGYQAVAGDGAVDPVPMGLLADLVRRHGALVVVSSTWRKMPDCRGVLVAAGLPPGRFHHDWATAILPGSVDASGAMRAADLADRGGEIAEHVARNGIGRYVILDDVDCGPRYAGRQVRPDASVGLTPADAKLADGLVAWQAMAA